MLEQINFAEENSNMTFNSPIPPISMLQSVFTNLPDVLPDRFFYVDLGGGGGERGIVILVMIWGKIMQFFDCSKVFWPQLSEFQEKN